MFGPNNITVGKHIHVQRKSLVAKVHSFILFFKEKADKRNF